MSFTGCLLLIAALSPSFPIKNTAVQSRKKHAFHANLAFFEKKARLFINEKTRCQVNMD